jgi:hypothetical protein
MYIYFFLVNSTRSRPSRPDPHAAAPGRTGEPSPECLSPLPTISCPPAAVGTVVGRSPGGAAAAELPPGSDLERRFDLHGGGGACPGLIRGRAMEWRRLVALSGLIRRRLTAAGVVTGPFWTQMALDGP